jgi:pimeloyl-ACP methyl ester carboxylesterase
MEHSTAVRFGSAQLSTGVRLHYAERGDRGGEPLILLHGWPDSWFTFSLLLPRLHPGLRVFALDQRGFGDSERPQEGYAIDDFARDVVAFMDAVGIDRATIAGHSFGSFVARRVAAASPERVTRLVLIGTGLQAGNAVTREVLDSIRDLPDNVPAEFARAFQASTAFAPVPSDFFDRVIDESLKLPGHLWREIFSGLLESDDRQALRQIRAPTLLIWGEHDALFPRDDQERLVQDIAGARLVVYPETGHCPNWERPDRLAADLAEFVANPRPS